MQPSIRPVKKDYARMPGHGHLPEPELAFHPTRPEYRSSHPLEGLQQFGPYSQSVVTRILGPIRVGVIAPAGGVAVIRALLREIEAAHQPRERRAYLRPFPGFSKVFRVGIVLAEADGCIELPASFDQEMERSRAPHALLADRVARALTQLLARRHAFDVLAIYLPDRWSSGFKSTEGGEDFDLHDFVKAIAAAQDIPTQFLNENGNSALTYRCRCSVMWRLGIAFYSKAGGVPWKLAAPEEGTAYIGISYALRPANGDDPQFVTCCSQIFDADGTGLEFLAYSPDDFQVKGENPFLSRAEMRRVMARSLSLFQRRHGGRNPRRIVVHKTTEFKPEETDGCFDALRASESIDLVQVQQDTPWRGIMLEEPRGPNGKAAPSGYPLLRGSYLPLSGRETLLWTQGDVWAEGEASGPVGEQHYFKEGKGIPSPILLRRYAGHGDWQASCRDVLSLTKMNWNSDSLYDRMPATLGFASNLARVIKRMDHLGSRPFQFRLFI